MLKSLGETILFVCDDERPVDRRSLTLRNERPPRGRKYAEMPSRASKIFQKDRMQEAVSNQTVSVYSLMDKLLATRGTILEIIGWTSVSGSCTRRRVSVDIYCHQLVPDYI